MALSASNYATKSHWRRAYDRLGEHPLAKLGPGLITGVADDDPSGIATYSQAGAQFGLNMLWTMPLAYPLMSVVQLMCAMIGRVTGKGLAANIRAAFPRFVLYVVVLLLLIANTLNISADLAAMGEAGELVTHINRHLMTLIFVVGSLALQVFVPYHRYVFFLKWLTLSLLAYLVVVFMVHVPWLDVVQRTFYPHLHLNSDEATVVVGVFGTTISPYLFFWQASEEVEDMREYHETQLRRDGGSAPSEIQRINFDTWTGMFYSNLTAYFIILATGVTLHVAGITDIQTAGEAASALRPLAGNLAFALFAVGIIGAGLIGVPVLAGSAAYALAEAMQWKWGLERKAENARGFYGVIAVSVLLALILQYTPINPMKALFWSAVINGVVAVPLLVVIVVLASSKKVMGRYAVGPLTKVLGWLTVGIMGLAAIAMWVL